MPAGLQQTVQEHARAAGFAAAGVAPVPRLGSAESEEHEHYFSEWIAQGHAGEMEYLKRRDALGRYVRGSLEIAVPWARSVIVCAARYGGGAENPLSTDPASREMGWIARYAWSGRQLDNGSFAPSDYHKVLLKRLKAVEASLHTELGAFRSWAYIDTGPLVERAFAAMAGVGWTGKNACTLNEDLGSFFFLGVILTDLEVAPEQRATLPADRCGSCTRCLDACPTHALIAPRQMNASRCIAYLTIEKRGPIDPALRPGIGRQIFGCDICQDVCPWNARARRHSFPPEPDLQTREELVNPRLSEMAALERCEWESMFSGSPVKRARWEGFRRNLAIAIGNSADTSLLPLLERWAAHEEDPVVQEAVQWALQHIQPVAAAISDLSQ